MIACHTGGWPDTEDPQRTERTASGCSCGCAGRCRPPSDAGGERDRRQEQFDARDRVP